ncbi:LacI family DNA-binding transcriptional regulator [Frondihabitans sp. PAMC 28766]|uniref:LacI family DNA-binding transcriptional regulator n=1 Tax=Frondihabitans sp. PAMC 28766 TaxID=1795630 RepID=UPI00138EE8E1|nr:LacI family DNA-binding transcriptional regulator [Frondihabitans sp. PAMC 28766]
MNHRGSDGISNATLRDVAARAGVSIRTVSNVVTSAVAVRPETRIQVEAAIEELDYRPNLAARRLRSRRAQVIGLVLPDVTLPYFREFADDVLTAASSHGFAVVVEQTHGDPERERTILDNPRLLHVDGIVLAAVTLGADEPDADDGRPVVLAGTEVFGESLDAVSLDQFAAGRAVGALLGRRGRTRPVLVAGRHPHWPIVDTERYRGFVDGLAAHGVTFDPERIVEVGAVALDDGRRAADVVLARFPDVDAVFANADALAVGVLAGLQDAGRSVPDEVALVGFGDIEYAAFTEPPLSTVDTMRGETARAAVEMLEARLSAPGTAPRRIDTGFRLVERASTGAASTEPELSRALSTGAASVEAAS